MEATIGAAIVGGTGYGAGELLRLCTQHPAIEVVSVVSASMAGAAISEAHPHLAGFYPGKLAEEIDFDTLSSYPSGVVFLALPHGTSAAYAQEILAEVERRGLRLIDLSGDFRLSDEQQRRAFYPEASVLQELQSRFVYGLTELNRTQIASAMLLSTPGCLATVCALAALPLVGPEFEGPIVFDVKTGSSGAGRSLNQSFHHPTRFSNMNPYKVLKHRHEPELCQALGDPNRGRLEVAFVPHVIPASRGCYATVYLTLPEKRSTAELLEDVRSFYEQSPFIRVRETPPDLQAIIGTNFCDISVHARGRQVVAMASLDNLVKGTAGQAIQNLNLACGLPETSGLWAPALGPC